MKPIYKCFDRFVSKENFEKAYYKSQQGKSAYKGRAIAFSLDWVKNLEELRQSVINETYQVSEYVKFKIYEPKERLIVAPHYIDKIVQYALTTILREIYEPTYVFNSYSCVRYKGNTHCVEDLKKYIRQAKHLYGNKCCILKMDVKKFFPSINHEILKMILSKRIKDEKMLNLMFKIIDSQDKKGLYLGNCTSQMFSNIYMNDYDHFVKRVLKCKFYIRYADDIIIFCENKNKARTIRDITIKYLEENLNLTVHKILINGIDRGVSAIGYRIKPTHTLMLRKNRIHVDYFNNYKNYVDRRIRMNCCLANGKLSDSMYLFGNRKGFEYNLKKHKFIFS